MKNQLNVSEVKYMYLDGHTDKITKTLKEVASSFCYIGFLLWEVRRYKYYESRNYSNVVEYAEKELGFKKSTTMNYIRLCEVFSTRTASGDPSMNLNLQFQDYSASQLTEMLSMSNEAIKLASPDMTVKQLRDVKKKVQTSGQNEEQLENQIDAYEVLDMDEPTVNDEDDDIENDIKCTEYEMKLGLRIQELEDRIRYLEKDKEVINNMFDYFNQNEKLTKRKMLDFINDFIATGEFDG